MIRRAMVALVSTTGVLLALTSTQASADTITTSCPDGSSVTVDFSADANDFLVQLTAACAGRTGEDSVDSDPGTDGAEAVADEPQGYWVYAGPVCDNGGICASQLLCADGSPMIQYIFVDPAGNRSDARNVCPGDLDIPEVTVTPPTPGQIFDAFKEVAPTKSELTVQPPGGQTLVNFPTIFSTVAQGFSTPPIALVEGFSAVFHISPAAYVWNHGDDSDAVTTTWPGLAWSEGADVGELLTHTYQSTEPVKASVTVTWGATVSLNGGEPQPVDGTVDALSPEVDLEILEALPQLVR